MIVQKKTDVGPGTSLSFEGGTAATPLESMRVFGKSTQASTPTPSTPVQIASIADGGTLTITFNGTQYAITLQSAIRGIRYVESEYGYLVGNGAYLTTQDGNRLLAK